MRPDGHRATTTTTTTTTAAAATTTKKPPPPHEDPMAEYESNAETGLDEIATTNRSGDTRNPDTQPPLTLDEIVAKVDELTGYIEDWRNDDDPSMYMIYRGESVKMISQTIESLSVELFQMVHTMHVEPDARELCLAIDVVEDRFLDWAGQAQAVGAYPAGTHEMWAQYDRMLEKTKPHRYTIPEPISSLKTQGVSTNQIAKMYGWYRDAPESYRDPDGRKVDEEQANPGTHFDPATWEPVEAKKHRAKIEDAWQERAERIGERYTLGDMMLAVQSRSDASARPKAEPVDAPETVEELVLQKVPVQQILKMKPGTTEEEIRTIAAQVGVALDGRVVRHVSPVEAVKERAEMEQKLQDEDLQWAQENAHLDLDAVEDRIWAVYQDGRPPADVLAILRRHHPEMSAQKVRGVINARKKAAQEKATA